MGEVDGAGWGRVSCGQCWGEEQGTAVLGAVGWGACGGVPNSEDFLQPLYVISFACVAPIARPVSQKSLQSLQSHSHGGRHA